MLEPDDAAAVVAGDLGLVEGNDDGDAPVEIELAQESHDAASRLGVERGDGLVGENDFGALHDGPGNGATLLLAAGERARPLGGAVVEPDGGEGLHGAVPVAWSVPEEEGAQGGRLGAGAHHDVAVQREASDEVEALEDEADARANLASLGAYSAALLDVVAPDLDGGVWRGIAGEQTVGEAEQSRFARAGGAEQGSHFAGLDF